MTDSGQEYEFNEEQNHELTKLWHHMKVLGFLLIGMGALFAILFVIVPLIEGNVSVTKEVIAILATIIFVILGAYTVRAANSFKLVVTTEGSDITNLMKAMHSMNIYFNVELMMVILGAVVLVLGFLLKYIL